MKPEEEKKAEKAKKEWADSRGLKESKRVPYCVCRLLKKHCRHYGSSECVHSPPQCDHPSLWLRNGKPAVFVFQPYGLTQLERLGAFCRERGLECAVDTWPAWHYPGAVLHVELSTSDEVEARRKYREARRKKD